MNLKKVAAEDLVEELLDRGYYAGHDIDDIIDQHYMKTGDTLIYECEVPDDIGCYDDEDIIEELYSRGYACIEHFNFDDVIDQVIQEIDKEPKHSVREFFTDILRLNRFASNEDIFTQLAKII